MSENSLVIFTKAEQMLAEADTIQKAKELKDLALTAADWAKRKNMGEQAIQHCRSYSIRAEVKLGEMLAQTERNKGAKAGRLPNGGIRTLPPLKDDKPTLAALGLTKRESAEAQALYALQKDDQEAVAEGRKTKAQARKAVRLQKSKEKEKAALAAVSDNAEWVVTDQQSVVECSALITDPPYGILDERWEPKKLESFTREWLSRWKKCKADIVLSFWSQHYLFDGRRWFDEEMDGYKFQQLLIWHYPNNKSPQSRMMFKQTWEPIFFYRKDGSSRRIGCCGSAWGEGLHDFDCHVAAVPQSNFKDADMKQHPAQKPVGVMRWLVNATTEPGELICDPFAGSGTTGIAAVQLKRRFHGIEKDHEFLKNARGRIAAYGNV